MKRLNPSFLALACAGLIASATVFSAQPGMDPPLGAQHVHERGPGSRMEGEPHHRGGLDMLHGVELSEAQRQKAFAVRHAAEPLMFEQMARVRTAHETLQQLSEATPFDDARASAAADALGSATAAMALGRARLAAQIQALLTVEQRAQLAARAPEPKHNDRSH